MCSVAENIRSFVLKSDEKFQSESRRTAFNPPPAIWDDSVHATQIACFAIKRREWHPTEHNQSSWVSHACFQRRSLNGLRGDWSYNEGSLKEPTKRQWVHRPRVFMTPCYRPCIHLIPIHLQPRPFPLHLDVFTLAKSVERKLCFRFSSHSCSPRRLERNFCHFNKLL